MHYFAFAVLIATCGLRAPGSERCATVQVVVYIGTPCLPAAHAQIVLPDLRRFALADSTGRATLPDVPAGVHRIRVHHVGYPQLTGTVRVVADVGDVYLLADLQAAELNMVLSSARYPRRDQDGPWLHPRAPFNESRAAFRGTPDRLVCRLSRSVG